VIGRTGDVINFYYYFFLLQNVLFLKFYNDDYTYFEHRFIDVTVNRIKEPMGLV